MRLTWRPASAEFLTQEESHHGPPAYCGRTWLLQSCPACGGFSCPFTLHDRIGAPAVALQAPPPKAVQLLLWLESNSTEQKSLLLPVFAPAEQISPLPVLLQVLPPAPCFTEHTFAPPEPPTP